MKKRMPRTLIAGLVLCLACAIAGPEAAYAKGCLSAGEARSAVQSGQAVSLSKLLRKIQKATGGEIVPPPKLCKQGGSLFYKVNVLAPNGKVKQVTVDAASGNLVGQH